MKEIFKGKKGLVHQFQNSDNFETQGPSGQKQGQGTLRAARSSPAAPGSRRKTRCLPFLPMACILFNTLIGPLFAIPSPTYIGAYGDKCDTVATSFDQFIDPSYDFVTVAGKSQSVRFINGAGYTSETTCLDTPVAFFQVLSNNNAYDPITFQGLVEINGVKGLYSEVTAVKYPDKTLFSNAFYNMVVVILQFQDMNGVTQDFGTTIAYYLGSSRRFVRFYTINHPAMTKEDIGFNSMNSIEASTAKLAMIRNANTPNLFDLYTIDSSTDAFSKFSGQPPELEQAFGATVVLIHNGYWMVGGTMKVAGRSGFVPVFYSFKYQRWMWIQPAEDTQPYFAPDRVTYLVGHGRGLQFFGTPRDVNYNMLKTNQHPLMVGNYLYDGNVGCGAANAQIIHAILIKVGNGEPDKYTIPLAVGSYFPSQMRLMFLKSSTSSSSMALSGTMDSYIGTVDTFLMISCSAGSTIIGQSYVVLTNQMIAANTQTEITFTDQFRYYRYFGRWCYTPTGVSPYCTLVSSEFRYINSIKDYMYTVTNQDRYYNDQSYHQIGILNPTDSTDHITYPNGDGTTNGKFIAIVNSIKSTETAITLAFVQDHPDWGSTYTKYAYDWSAKTHETVVQTLTATTLSMPTYESCNTLPITVADNTASGVLPAGKSVIQIYEGDNSGDSLVVTNPFTFTCTGSACSQCPMITQIVPTLDVSQTLVQSENIPKFATARSDGKVEMRWMSKGVAKNYHVSFLAYTYTTFMETGTLQRPSQFILYVANQLYYEYPSCAELCTYQSTNGDEMAILNRIYYVGTQCLLVFQECTTAACFNSPDLNTDKVRTVACPTKICTAIDNLAANSNPVVEVSKDVSELPFSFDLISNINNPNSLSLNTAKVSSSTASYSALNSSYTGLFSTQVAQATIVLNVQSTPFEFDQETFYLEVSSTTCVNVHDTIVHQSQVPTSDSSGQVTSYIPFKIKIIHCNGQVVSPNTASPLYLEVQKNSGTQVLITTSLRDAQFSVSDSTRCPISRFSIVNDQNSAFAANDAQYSDLNLAAWTSHDQITTQTTHSSSVALQRKYTFQLEAETKGRTKYGQVAYKQVEVVVGCFAETTLTAALKTLTPSLQTNIFKYDDLPDEVSAAQNSKLKLLYHKEIKPTSDQASYTETLNLNDLVSWATDLPDCFASNVSLCVDESCSVLSTATDVYLTQNPTNKDEQGWVNPVLKIDRRTPSSKFIYIRGTTNSGLVSDMVKANLIVCGQEEVKLVKPENEVFNIELDQEEGQEKWASYLLTGTWTVESQSGNVLDSDCPLDHYVVCSMEVSECTKDTNLTTDETFFLSETNEGVMLNIRRDTPLNNKKFQISASTKSGQKNTQIINTLICGNENITINPDQYNLGEAGKIFVRKDMDFDMSSVVFEVRKMFRNDFPDCPIVGYRLVKNPTVESADIKASQKINYVLDLEQMTFTIRPVIQSTLKFYLVAFTASGRLAAIEVFAELYKLTSPPNEFPTYPDVPAVIDVHLYFDEMQNLINKGDIVINSGLPTDDEEDEIELLSVDQNLYFVKMTQNNTEFSIIIDTSVLTPTHEGLYGLRVKVNDSAHAYGESKKILITLNIIAELEIQDQTEEEESESEEFVFDWEKETQKKLQRSNRNYGLTPEKREDSYLPLICEIEITTLGKLTFICNQAFKAERLTQALAVQGRRMQASDFFSLAIEPGDQDAMEEVDLSLLDFYWDLEQYDETANQLQFQVNFTHPVMVSQSMHRDIITVEVVDPSLIVSRQFGRPIEMPVPIKTQVTKQMYNTETTQQYYKTTEQTNTAVAGTTIFTFLLEFVFNGAMKEIMGAILGLQIILFGSLTYVNIPGNILTFYQKLKPIASFNVVAILSKVTNYVFVVDSAQQIALRRNIISTAQALQIKYHNAIKNLGNFFYFLLAYFSDIGLMAWYYYRKVDEEKLKVHKKKFEALRKRIVFNRLIQIGVSGCIPISIAVYFQAKSPLFTTFGEVCGVIFGFLFFVLVYLFTPFALLYTFSVDQEMLSVPAFKERWGAAYAGIRLETRWQRSHKLIFVLRRLAILYIGLEMHLVPFFQLQIFNIMNIFVIIYQGQSEPLPGRFAKRMELFNEVMIATITYQLFMFTDALPSQEAQYIIGWSLVGCLSAMLAVNSFFVIKGIVAKLKLLALKKYKLRKATEDRKLAMIEKEKKDKAKAEKAAKKEAKRVEMVKKLARENLDILQAISNPFLAINTPAKAPAKKQKVITPRKLFKPRRQPKSTTQLKNLTVIEEDLNETVNEEPQTAITFTTPNKVAKQKEERWAKRVNKNFSNTVKVSSQSLGASKKTTVHLNQLFDIDSVEMPQSALSPATTKKSSRRRRAIPLKATEADQAQSIFGDF